MASVERIKRKPKGGREQVSYLVRYRDPMHRQRGRSFRRKVDAERFAASVETDKARGAWTDPAKGRITVAAWSKQWLDSKVDLRATSRARLIGIVGTHILPEFGSCPLDEVTNADVRGWVARLTSTRSPSTVRKSHNALGQMMRAAVADRRIAFDPSADVPLPPEHFDEQQFLTVEQVGNLADAIEPRFRAMVLLAAYGGLRFGELAGLRRNRVDVFRGRVEVSETLIDVHGQPLSFGPPKSKRSRRTVPLPRAVVAELSRHLDTYTGSEPNSLVFTGPRGAPLRRAGFRRLWWEPATAEARLTELKVHELRHTFVALSVAAGCDPRKVSVRAGHSTVAFTLDRYGHLFEADEREDMDRMDALLTTKPVRQAAAVVELPVPQRTS